MVNGYGRTFYAGNTLHNYFLVGWHSAEQSKASSMLGMKLHKLNWSSPGGKGAVYDFTDTSSTDFFFTCKPSKDSHNRISRNCHYVIRGIKNSYRPSFIDKTPKGYYSSLLP